MINVMHESHPAVVDFTYLFWLKICVEKVLNSNYQNQKLSLKKLVESNMSQWSMRKSMCLRNLQESSSRRSDRVKQRCLICRTKGMAKCDWNSKFLHED